MLTLSRIEVLIFKYIDRHYPISRIKQNKRFRRGIILDSGTYFIAQPGDSLKIKGELYEIILTTFNCDEKLIKNVLDRFLKLT